MCDILIVFLKEFLKKLNYEMNQLMTNKRKKFHSMQRINKARIFLLVDLRNFFFQI